MTAQKVLDKIEEYIREHDNLIYSFEFTKEDIEIIKSALAKQISKRPISKTDEIFGDAIIICPNCENSGLVNPVAHSGKTFNYCPKCGQRLNNEHYAIDIEDLLFFINN